MVSITLPCSFTVSLLPLAGRALAFMPVLFRRQAVSSLNSLLHPCCTVVLPAVLPPCHRLNEIRFLVSAMSDLVRELTCDFCLQTVMLDASLSQVAQSVWGLVQAGVARGRVAMMSQSL